MNSTTNRLASTSTTISNNKNRLSKSSKIKSKSTAVLSSNNNRRSIVNKRQRYVSINEAKNKQLYDSNDNKLKKTNCVTPKFLTKYDAKKIGSGQKNIVDAATEEEDVVLGSCLKKVQIKNNINNCMTATEEEGALEEIRQHRFCQNLGLNLSKIEHFNSQKELLSKKGKLFLKNKNFFFKLSIHFLILFRWSSSFNVM